MRRLLLRAVEVYSVNETVLTYQKGLGGWWCIDCKREFNGHRDAESHVEKEHGYPPERITTDHITGDIFVTEKKVEG